MQQSLINEDDLKTLAKVEFLVGSCEGLADIKGEPYSPYDDATIEFLNAVSKNIREIKEARNYPDVVTFGFFIRKASLMALSDKYKFNDGNIHVGRGITFHIAPSNVAVNYAYSLVAGLLTGNVCIVRIPSKDFTQINIINSAINATLSLEEYAQFRKRIFLIRYDRSQAINDIFSRICDVRIIWGGDNTISELRKSPIKARTTEVTFADRYSLAVIDSDVYVSLDEAAKKRLADDFYNDTYLTDQNACTSPRLVAWLGKDKDLAKDEFWTRFHELVKNKYTFQPIMGVNKITKAYILAAQSLSTNAMDKDRCGDECTSKKANAGYNPRIIKTEDNYLMRVKVDSVDAELMEYKDNSGFFFEYDCESILELEDFCDNTHCQTIGFLGNKEDIMPLITSGIKGVDRVVPIGKTMDFDFIWDGYNLNERLTRTISVLA